MGRDVLDKSALYSRVPIYRARLLFRLPQEAGIIYRIALRVGIERFQSHIDAAMLTRRLMHHLPAHLYTELHEVAVCSSHDTHSFDLLHGEGFDLPLGFSSVSGLCGENSSWARTQKCDAHSDCSITRASTAPLPRISSSFRCSSGEYCVVLLSGVNNARHSPFTTSRS